MVSGLGSGYFPSHWADLRTVTENFQDKCPHSYIHVHICIHRHRYTELCTVLVIHEGSVSSWYYSWLEVILISCLQYRNVNLIMEIYRGAYLTQLPSSFCSYRREKDNSKHHRAAGMTVCSVKWREKHRNAALLRGELLAVIFYPYSGENRNVYDGWRETPKEAWVHPMPDRHYARASSNLVLPMAILLVKVRIMRLLFIQTHTASKSWHWESNQV